MYISNIQQNKNGRNKIIALYSTTNITTYGSLKIQKDLSLNTETFQNMKNQ
jgi:hypothetical protein